MTDTEDGAIGLRREPGYRELDCEEQQRAGNAVDELCSEVVPDNVLPRVVVPSALDDTTRQVVELRRRHGYQVPEFFELNGYARSRVEHGADPDVFVSDWRVVNSDGEAPPRRLWTTGEYVVFAGTAFVGVFLLCAAIGTLLAVLGYGVGISDAALGKLITGVLLGAPVLSAAGSAATVVRLYLDNRAVKNPQVGAERYELTLDQIDAMRRHAVPVEPQWPEIRLAAVAEHLAKRIEASTAWTDTVLDEHRIVFSPEREAEQLRAHAMRIASMRARLGEAPAGDTSDHEQARAALRLEHELLERIVQSLHERVAALWSYAVNVEELSSQIAALRAIENSMALAPELDALARQTGVDELATRQLRTLSADAETISVKIAAITATLTNVLAPVSANESRDYIDTDDPPASSE
ncbi:hypothetical protein AAHS21_14050 [Mycobacterium sp. 050272]|uniref:hypothetical protein n=1 Tax=Mycobacterium sp. 050272 TaxID=3142488 RepID=UPI003186D88B